MNQKALQPGFYKSVNCFLDFLPVAAVVAGHQFIDGQAAVHLEVKDSLCLFKCKDAVRHEPGNIMLLVIRHFINDLCKDRIVQQQVAEHVITVDFVTERVRAVRSIAFL